MKKFSLFLIILILNCYYTKKPFMLKNDESDKVNGMQIFFYDENLKNLPILFRIITIIQIYLIFLMANLFMFPPVSLVIIFVGVFLIHFLYQTYVYMTDLWYKLFMKFFMRKPFMWLYRLAARTEVPKEVINREYVTQKWKNMKQEQEREEEGKPMTDEEKQTRDENQVPYPPKLVVMVPFVGDDLPKTKEELEWERKFNIVQEYYGLSGGEEGEEEEGEEEGGSAPPIEEEPEEEEEQNQGRLLEEKKDENYEKFYDFVEDERVDEFSKNLKELLEQRNSMGNEETGRKLEEFLKNNDISQEDLEEILKEFENQQNQTQENFEENIKK